MQNARGLTETNQFACRSISLTYDVPNIIGDWLRKSNITCGSLRIAGQNLGLCVRAEPNLCSSDKTKYVKFNQIFRFSKKVKYVILGIMIFDHLVQQPKLEEDMENMTLLNIARTNIFSRHLHHRRSRGAKRMLLIVYQEFFAGFSILSEIALLN